MARQPAGSRSKISTGSGFTFANWPITPTSACSGYSDPEYVVPTDIDGDGKTDLVRAHFGSTIDPNDYILSLRSTGSGFTYQRVDLIQNIDALQLPPRLYGDFNGDGKGDIATAFDGPSAFDSGIIVYLSNGTTFIEQQWAGYSLVSLNAEGYWRTGDFNGDGRDDIASFDINLSGGPTFTESTPQRR
jgi:hypothetical protein